jgi:hypothetical protein
LGFLHLNLTLTVLFATPVDVNVGVLGEARAGQTPLIAGTAPRDFVAGVLTPEASLDVRQPETSLRLGYFPRLFWQKADGVPAAGPLVLHQAALTLASEPTATTRVALQASGSVGEPDYAALPQLLGTGQTVLPAAVKVLSLSASAGVQSDVTRRWQLTFAGTAHRFQPLGEQTPAVIDPMAPPVPSTILTETSFSAVPGAAFRVTRTDELRFAVGGAFATYSNGVQLLIVNPSLGWRTRLQPGLDLWLTFGLAFPRDLGSRAAAAGQPVAVPTGAAELNCRLMTEGESKLTARFRTGVDEYIDPVLAIAGPRFLGSAAVIFEPHPGWSAALQAELATVWATIPTSPGGVPPDLTSASVALPLRHRLTNHLVIEVGGRWGDRGPALSSSNFEFHQRQTWAYVTLTATTRDAAPGSLGP